jgi:hypothetical protein
MIIRNFWKSAGLALAFLVGDPLAVAQAQYNDYRYEIPPSPSPPPYKSSQWGSIPVGTPAPNLTSPPLSSSTNAPATGGLSPAYNMTRLPGAKQQASRAVIPANPNRPPQPVGPFGAGSRRPDAQKGAYDPSRWSSPAVHNAAVAAPMGTAAGTDRVTQVKYDESPATGFMEPIPPAAMDATNSSLLHRSKPIQLPPGGNFPTERVGPPMILGSHLGLLPGETATERSMRLMSAVGDLERQVQALDQRNTEQSQLIKQRDDQLLLAIREIKSARKEIITARDELEHLRQQVRALQDKVRDAERDNAALLQTMAPLLQKLLDSDAATQPDESQE